MRLKSRDKWPPHGFQLLLPEIGMKEPISGSFTEIVDAFARIVAKNAALAEKHGWPSDRDSQEEWIDYRESQRMVAHGWLKFVDLGGDSPVVKKTLQGKYRSVVNAAGNVKTALSIYRDLFGPDGKIVAKEESERRAAICVSCSGNDTDGGLKKYFFKEAAHELMSVFGMLKDMDVSTSHDAKLGVCKFCECPLVAKCHVESHVLKKHLKPDQIAKLDPGCWIRPIVA